MNIKALYHRPDSNFCFPLSDHEITIRLRVDAADHFAKVELVYNSKYLIQGQQLVKTMARAYDDGTFAYYEITLDLKDTRLAYVFRLYEGSQAYYFSERGLTQTYDFNLSYYDFFQFPFINDADVIKVPAWTKKALFYEIFVDRFNKGDTTKDQSYITMKWGAIPTNHDYAGGDLKGIIQKLDYIKGWGFNALYLTPIFKSRSYHKYDIEDYDKVDSQFGNLDDLKALVKKAHKRDIKVVLDGVFNHCSWNLKQFQDVVKNGRASPYADWFIFKGDHLNLDEPNYEMFAFCKDMPKLNSSNSEVQRFVCDIGARYVKEYGIDGWRLDVSDEVSHDLWRGFRKTVKALNPDCLILGENWHDSYPFLIGDQFDGVMNYPFTKACLDGFKKPGLSAAALAGRLNGLLVREKGPINQMMLNLLDSHDTHRFFSEVDEDKDRLLAALALLLVYPGMPCVYYGTEIPLPGGYDPDSRRCFPWGQPQNGEYQKALRRLLALRTLKPVQEGETRIVSKGTMLAVDRFIPDGPSVTLYLNMGPEGAYFQADGDVVASSNFVGPLLPSFGYVVTLKGE